MPTIKTDGNHLLDNPSPSQVSSIAAYGTWGGASITLGFMGTDATVHAYGSDNTAKTANGEWLLRHGAGVKVYAIVTGATGTTDIYVEARPV